MKGAETSLPHPGTPPEAVRRQDEYIKQLLVSGESIPGGTTDKDPIIQEVPEPEMSHLPVVAVPNSGAGGRLFFPEMAIPTDRVKRVELVSFSTDPGIPNFTLAFNVVEACIREHYISLMLATDMGFKPSGMAKFDLKYKNRSYPVIFVGAEFEFQSVKIRGISFLIDQDRLKAQKNDKAR